MSDDHVIEESSGMYLEHDKRSKVLSRSQEIGDFLDWITHEKGWFLAEVPKFEDHPDNNCVYPVYYSPESLLAEYFDIDLDRIELERRDMLKRLRGEQE